LHKGKFTRCANFELTDFEIPEIMQFLFYFPNANFSKIKIALFCEHFP
jgi:hypothetical protein